MNIQDYLSRIQFNGELDTTQETLHTLQLSHLKAIPFENLDISLKREIKLDMESLWEKIIIKKRGGFCYELNGLFAWLLKNIGFQVTYLNARVNQSGTLGIDFDHLTLMVEIPAQSTRWLADVGWGDTFTQPLEIDNPNWQQQGLRAYQLEPLQNGYQLWQRGYGGRTERQYFFDLVAHSYPSEYEAACIYHQTSPHSIFTTNRIISRLTEDGRISLENQELIVTKNGKRIKSAVNEKQRDFLLKDHFGMVL